MPYDPTRWRSPAAWLHYNDEVPYDYDEYEPLFSTLRERGSGPMILFPAERWKRVKGGSRLWAQLVPIEHENDPDLEDAYFPFEVEPSREALRPILRDPGFSTNMHPSYFSPEGDWGLQTMLAGVSVLGGTPDFMAAFYRHAGGRNAVRQRFIDYDVGAAWESAHVRTGIEPCAPGEYPFDDTSRKLFYDMIGWETPQYDMDEIRRTCPWMFKAPEG